MKFYNKFYNKIKYPGIVDRRMSTKISRIFRLAGTKSNPTYAKKIRKNRQQKQ